MSSPSASPSSPAAAPSKKKVSAPRKSTLERAPGTSLLPVARVQRIIRADKDMDSCAKESVFLVSVATEFFIKKLMDAGYVEARLDKRKWVHHKDLANAVKKSDEFHFLEEIIPHTMPLSTALSKRAAKASGAPEAVGEDEPAGGGIAAYMESGAAAGGKKGRASKGKGRASNGGGSAAVRKRRPSAKAKEAAGDVEPEDASAAADEGEEGEGEAMDE